MYSGSITSEGDVYIHCGSLSRVLLTKKQLQKCLTLSDYNEPLFIVFDNNRKTVATEKEIVTAAAEVFNGPSEVIIFYKGELSCLNELEELGKIVQWCSQLDVLCHPSLGCFVTHCGWNSTIESVAAGVPVVAFPQWADQHTNAKMMEDVWKVGVKVKSNEEGIVEGNEIVRCLKIVMGEEERGKEIRENAKKLRQLAMEAAGASSDLNLRTFVKEFC